MECHIQAFSRNQWHESAIVSCNDISQGGVKARSTFEYDLDYAFLLDSQPVSLVFPVDAEHHSLTQWPAFLYDLIPQGAGRKYLLGQLDLADGPAADFALICAGAFNPIGSIRVKEAVDFYQHHISLHDPAHFIGGMSLTQIVERDDAFAERMLAHGMLAASTTGVQGAAPKYLLTCDHENRWHADGALDDAHAASHYIVKLPRGKTAADKKVLRNEAAYMRVAQAMGLDTHAQLELRNDMLFIPRFDRAALKGKVQRYSQESAASIAGVVGFDARPTQYDLLRGLRRVLTDKEKGTIEFLLRDVLNLAMRNTDNHARNTAVQKIGHEVKLTPLFDFAPMYLDPETIARTARWYHPMTKTELKNWHDVIAALDVPEAEKNVIRMQMAAFGEKIETLADCMHECGVDNDIIAHLGNGIDEQILQLRELTMQRL